jgi:IMP cyclohydrolase
VSDLVDRAEATLARHVVANPYPGRGLVLGRSADGEAWLQLYWIMGRSANSRNRVFVRTGATLRTEPFDPAAVEDPSLIIYEAMLELERAYVVSNGDQTRTIYEALAQGGSFEAALATREREPDAPNFTPRISGLIDLRGAAPAFALSLLKANRADPERTDRTTFRPAPPPPGLGLGLTTYQGDGSPLPPIEGEPLWLPLAGPPETVLERYWGALDRDNRVALALKRIPLGGGVGSLLLRNRHLR